jgi:hypothetical protein
MIRPFIKSTHGMERHGRRIGRNKIYLILLKIVTPILIISLFSCKYANTSEPTLNLDSLKKAITTQVEAKVESTANRVVPAFIGKAMGQYVQQLSDSLLILKKQSDAQVKEIAALRLMIRQNTDTLMMLKKDVIGPYPGHFDFDSRTGLFYIKGMRR